MPQETKKPKAEFELVALYCGQVAVISVGLSVGMKVGLPSGVLQEAEPGLE